LLHAVWMAVALQYVQPVVGLPFVYQVELM
jgi:hypothetical protein